MLLMIFQVIGVLLICSACVAGGWWIAGRPKPWWPMAYLVGLAVLLFIALPNYFNRLYFVWPFSSIMSGRNEFVLMGVGAGLVLATLVRKADKKSYKVGLSVLMVLGVAIYAIGPFMLPMILYNRHLKMETKWEDGQCYQTTEYTCGPAAAVTALRMLDIPAEEGELSLACYTTSSSGTQPDSLAEGIEDLYKDQGVKASYVYYDTLESMNLENGYAIAVIKWSMLVDHYVMITEVNDDFVYVADPVRGPNAFSHEEFKKIWKKAGVAIYRK